MHSRRLILLGAALALAIGAAWWRPQPAAADGGSAERPAVATAVLAPRRAAPAVPPETHGAPRPAAVPALWSVPRDVSGETLQPRSAAHLAAVARGAPPSGRVAIIDPASPDALAALERGGRVRLPLPDGGEVLGQVNLVLREPAGGVRIGGALVGAARGSFSLSGQGLALTGRILLPEAALAYEIGPAVGGAARIRERALSELLCFPIPRPNDEPATAAPSGPQGAPPLLSSRPGALAVLYLDFDGETVTDPDWNDGNTIVAAASPLNATEITEVWNRVQEDFLPFNVDVTTDVTRYNNAPVNRRSRCIITPSSSWYPSFVGGVAWVGSFRTAGSTFSATVPCWAFNNSPATIAEVVSHEFGHTLGLLHHGTTSGATYYSGHGSGAVSWAPIMGVAYSAALSQWSKGEYPNANNRGQDDIGVIANLSTNGLGFVADEAGNTRATAAALNAPSGTIAQTGLITSSADVDYFVFTVTGPSSFSLAGAPAAIAPNLDLGLELQDASGAVLASSNPDLQLNASLSLTLSAGTYYIRVQGVGRGTVLGDGYSNYGSIGPYALSGLLGTIGPPVITAPPVAQTVTAGSTLAFSVSAASTAALTYQWRRDGSALPGETKSTLVLAHVTAAHAGSYSVAVTNLVTTVTSQPVALTVLSPPLITAHPLGVSTSLGQRADFTAGATGTGPLLYAWRRNGTPLAGATTTTLTLPSVQPADAGSYTFVVTNTVGSVISNAAVLVVQFDAPAIATHPVSQTVNAGATATLGVGATGGALTYQWRRNGAPLAGATGATLVLSNVTGALAGSFDVVVTNPAGTLTSNVAVLGVRLPPVIATAPLSQAVVPGTAVAFSVVMTGTAPFTLQWTKNGVPISGANAATLTIGSAQTADAGSYAVTVSNPAGGVASAAAALHVFPALPHAAHAIATNGYRPGATVTVTNALAYTGAVVGLGWQVLLPAGWTFHSASGSRGDVTPTAGTPGVIEWAWTNVPASPITFGYTLNVPATQAGDAQIVARAIVRPAGSAAAVELLGKPDPLVIGRAAYHAADSDFDFAMSLFELTRIIELYNTRRGTVRTGAYRIDASGEDGFAADAARAESATVTLALYHSADTRGAAPAGPDGRIDLFELTRVIELYNTRAGTVRTGRYHVQQGTEDGFAAGP